MGLACDLLGIGCAPRKRSHGLRGSDIDHAKIVAGAARVAATGLTEAIRAARKGKTRWECKAAYDTFMRAVFAAGQAAGNAEAVDEPTKGKAGQILTDPRYDYVEATFTAKGDRYKRASADKLARAGNRLMLQAESDIRKCFLRVAKSRAAGAATLED